MNYSSIWLSPPVLVLLRWTPFLLRRRGIYWRGIDCLLGRFCGFLRDGFGRQIKTQSEGLGSPLEILIPSSRLYIYEMFLTKWIFIFTDFRLLLDLMHLILSFRDGLFLFEMVALLHVFLLCLIDFMSRRWGGYISSLIIWVWFHFFLLFPNWVDSSMV